MFNKKVGDVNAIVNDLSGLASLFNDYKEILRKIAAANRSMASNRPRRGAGGRVRLSPSGPRGGGPDFEVQIAVLKKDGEKLIVQIKAVTRKIFLEEREL